jgi:hypothetical protein
VSKNVLVLISNVKERPWVEDVRENAEENVCIKGEGETGGWKNFRIVELRNLCSSPNISQ